MTPFEDFFNGQIFVINLARRPDRLEHFMAEMRSIGVNHYQRFEAVDAGKNMGNHGCTASHRAVLDLIVSRQIPKAFVFEDDATLRDAYRSTFHGDFQAAASQLPEGWQMFYLGGHYGEDPRSRIGKNLILMGSMKTTSSYGVTLQAATELRDIIPVGSGDSIDNLYAGYNRTRPCYISEPRFFVQYNNYSDLQQRQMNNTPCMEDGTHVARLDKLHV